MKMIKVGEKVKIGGNKRFVLIAGPCAIETEAIVMETAKKLKEICERLDVELIFKSSFDKANRSSNGSARGVGIDEGLRILKKVKDEYDLPIVTDVHESYQCAKVAEVVDMIQIPAFLCRQTDLLIAAAQTGLPVNIKKGQFLAPWDMKNVLKKVIESGNPNVLICERGTSFGYNNLVVDFTGIIEMKNYGQPIVLDVTHAVQKPGGLGASTGGNREYVPYLMNAGLSIGVDAIFAEVHPNPEEAISDGPNQIYLKDIEGILVDAIKYDKITKGE